MSETRIVEPCRVIGVLDNGIDGLTPQARVHIEHADVVIGGTRAIALFDSTISSRAVRYDLTGQLLKVPEWIRQAQGDGLRVAVLATGDPLCHGIAGFLISRLCIDALEIVPNVSTIQLACARLGIAWQDMKICSVHARDAGEWVPGADATHGLYAILQATRHHERLAILTSPENSPGRIARMLVKEGMAEEFQLAVAERLLQEDERIVANIGVADVAKHEFADPNVVLLWRTQAMPREVLFGLADDAYKQRHPEKGLITKREVRAVSLARMQLRHDSIVWDIGAGSGSVGLEAARIARHGHVYAIEKNAEDAANAQDNRRTMGIHNYTLLQAKAPSGIEHWPNPDAVFVGGSGGELAELIRLCLRRIKKQGVLVMNFVTFENLGMAIQTLKDMQVTWDVTQLQTSRSRPILDMHRLAAENPVWIVCASRAEEIES